MVAQQTSQICTGGSQPWHHVFGERYSCLAPLDAPWDGGSLPYLQVGTDAREGVRRNLRTWSWEGVALTCPVFSPIPLSCRQCQQDTALWQTLHLDQSISLDELLNISQVSTGVPGARRQS